MAKETGLGLAGLSVDDSAGSAQDIRDWVTNFDFSMPRATQDVTGVDKFAFERLLLLADFQINLTYSFDDAANTAFQVFKTVPSTSVERTVSLDISGNTLDTECVFTTFDWTRANTGALNGTSQGLLADGATPTWA